MPCIVISSLRNFITIHIRSAYLHSSQAFNSSTSPRVHPHLASWQPRRLTGVLGRSQLPTKSGHKKYWPESSLSTVATAATAHVPALGMDSDLLDLIRHIHASPTRAVFYITGGGLQVRLNLCHQSRFKYYGNN